MKTIEEKAKRYDEAIEALRSLFAEQAIKHCDRVNIKQLILNKLNHPLILALFESREDGFC
jgi:hypothetical protein